MNRATRKKLLQDVHDNPLPAVQQLCLALQAAEVDRDTAERLLVRIWEWFGSPYVQAAFDLQASHGGVAGEDGRRFSEAAGRLWADVRGYYQNDTWLREEKKEG